MSELRQILMIALVFLCVSTSAQRAINWKMTFINIGVSTAAIALEMTGDAMYDMGKEAGNVNQMKWGHTLQAGGHALPFVTLPFIYKQTDGRWFQLVTVSIGTYIMMRGATADLFYNVTRGLPLLYAGTTSMHDNIVSEIPPVGRATYKLVFVGFAIGFNINYW